MTSAKIYNLLNETDKKRVIALLFSLNKKYGLEQSPNPTQDKKTTARLPGKLVSSEAYRIMNFLPGVANKTNYLKKFNKFLKYRNIYNSIKNDDRFPCEKIKIKKQLYFLKEDFLYLVKKEVDLDTRKMKMVFNLKNYRDEPHFAIFFKNKGWKEVYLNFLDVLPCQLNSSIKNSRFLARGTYIDNGIHNFYQVLNLSNFKYLE